MQIDVDFDVFKALTALREHEAHDYNEVLRDLLKLPRTPRRALSDAMPGMSRPNRQKGFALRGGELPEGTDLRATYKGAEYRATIRNGIWRDEEGNEHSSPSSSASAISGTNVNGLRFWNARRPGDDDWTRLDILMAIGA